MQGRIMKNEIQKSLPGIPSVSDLSPDAKKAIFRETVKRRLVREMDRQIDAATADVGELIGDFLRTRKSDHTRRRYRRALDVWLTWCDGAGVHPILASAREADLFSAQIGGAPASANNTISAVSSWYSTLLKWGKISRTPFVKISRRTETAPAHSVPSEKEVRAILTDSASSPAIIAMAYRGFRVGALRGLRVSGSRFQTVSKGKSWTGELPPVVLRAIRGLGDRPFAPVPASTIQAAFKRITARLAAEGKIEHAYSVHDLRHFYATREYKKDHDLVRVSRLLNHGDVKVTTKYLHDLGIL